MVECDDAIGDAFDDVHVMLDHEDRVAAVLAQFADQLCDLVRLRRFIPAAGSSRSRMRGSVAIARAISRRRRFAYERLYAG